MIAAVDVGYQGSRALAACVLFPAWSAQAPASTHTAVVDDVKAYQPGKFWKRELPCILSVLRQLNSPPQTVVVDGYVWLDAAHRAQVHRLVHLGGVFEESAVGRTRSGEQVPDE